MENTNVIAPVTRFSSHARVQMQRRSIPEAAVELILDFATYSASGNGTRRYRFDKSSWAEAAAALGSSVAAFEKFRNAYVIEGNDGIVVTAAWRH